MAKETDSPPVDWELTVPVPIEPGLYQATVKSVALKIAEEDERPWLAWTFTLADGREVGGGSSFSIATGSKAYGWIVALLGRAMMGGGAVIHPLDIEGKPCQISIDTTEEGRSKVVAVLPPAKS
jgi:hypothetical protein